jgi:hypothetical protein
MRTLRLLFTSIFAGGLLLVNAFAQPAAVNSILTDPAYPVVDQPVTIYINANFYGLSTDNDQLSAWTGLITSASTDLTDNWLHNPISSWTDESIVLSRVADVNNDSVFQLVITDLADFYGVNTSEETVFRIAFIARGHAGAGLSGQTSNIYFEVFGSEPTAVASAYPSASANLRIALDFNINAATNTSLTEFIATNPDTLVYAHTGLATNVGEWQHLIAEWGVNTAKNTLLTVSDSVYRMYIPTTVRAFYGATAEEAVQGINLVLRNAGGTAKTEDLYIELSDTTTLPSAINEEVSDNYGIKAYPNPATDLINIELNKAQTATVNFYTVQGQLVYSENVIGKQNISINVSNFTVDAGTLIYQVITENEIVQGQLILVK